MFTIQLAHRNVAFDKRPMANRIAKDFAINDLPAA